MFSKDKGLSYKQYDLMKPKKVPAKLSSNIPHTSLLVVKEKQSVL